jgi:chromosome segregation ATPase
VQVSQSEVRARARKILLKAAHGAKHGSGMLAGFVAQALHGKKMGFDKVTGMIDQMIQTLKVEQKDDDGKKDYCSVELDKADDEKKATARAITDSTAAIEAAKEGIATAVQEIEALIASTRSLDGKVAEATQQRKEENAEYLDLIANDRAAKELLKMARNRLNKFYNPKLYQPPAKIERDAIDAIAEDVGGVTLVQVASRDQDEGEEVPPPPPETFGAYQKNTQQSGGVIQMMNLLITDLEKDMVEAETEEKNAQTDYEELMAEAAKKRAKDSKTLTGTEASKAEMEADLQAHTQAKKEATRELAAVQKYILSLHAECDFLLKYYDVRKDMRAGEIDALGKAKSVLAGADFSLLQLGSSTRSLPGPPHL